MIRRWVTPRITEQAEEPTGFDSFDLRLGDVMRGERATLGKSLLDVQNELRIKAAYIAAIENADVKAFETPSFIAGYVRSYARYLDMDPDWAFDTFCRESGHVSAHGLTSGRARPEKAARKTGQSGQSDGPDPFAGIAFAPQPGSIFEGIEPGAVGSVAVLLALIGVLGFGGYSVLREIQKVDFAPVEQSVGVLESIPGLGADSPAATGGGAAKLAGEAGASGPPVTPPTAQALDRLYRPQALDVPVLIARDGPISTLDPADVGVLAGTETTRPAAGPATDPVSASRVAGSASDAAATAPVPGGVRVFGPDAPEVAIFAVRPSWVRVRAADGSVILEKILDTGEKYVLPPLEAAPTLRSGNSGSVYFAVNGTAYGPAGEGASVVKNVVLAPGALTESYAVADPAADQALADFVAVAEASVD
ncbi:MAG: helix-turn-helix domain-containing protein [Rhodobacterales bacterium]|nr:MAG: helix-turn-helix domain-containing protein [Rhodobacterales bacterium]